MNDSLRLPICLLLAIVLLMASAPLGMASIYDPVGNRLTKTDNGVTTAYTYDGNDQLLTEGGTTYSYDANGNLIGKQGDTENVTYSYDYQNRLINVETSGGSASSVVYLYDVDGIRTQQIVNGTDVTDYLVDKNRPYAQVLEERDGSNALQVSYIYGDDLISQNRSGVDSYYHYDGQLSTRALTDAMANLTDTYTYDAFGNLLARTGATENNYLYTGEQYDPNAGFYYLRARYYDTGIGRFITTEPWQGSSYDPASLHKYLYVGADPVNNWDPSGNESYTLAEQPPKISLLGTLARGASIALQPYLKYFTLRTLLAQLMALGVEGVGIYTLAEWIDDQSKAEEYVDEIDTGRSSCGPCMPYGAGTMLNKATHSERDHGGCLGRMSSMTHWHYDIVRQNPTTCECFINHHEFGGCGAAPPPYIYYDGPVWPAW